MKYTLTLFALIIVNVAFSQTKKSLLNEMRSYAEEKIYNKPFDAEYKDLFNALIIVGHQEYPTLVKESESRGFVDFKIETETLQESLTMEILGDKKPYRVSFQMNIKSRSKTWDGKLSDWVVSTPPSSYIFKLQYSIYKILFGELIYPEELLDRIEEYNATQKKDRTKILKGKDY